MLTNLDQLTIKKRCNEISRKVRAICEEGQIKFLDEAPKGNFEVIIIFPDKGFKEKKRDFEPIAFGVWKDKDDIRSSAEWVRDLREQ